MAADSYDWNPEDAPRDSRHVAVALDGSVHSRVCLSTTLVLLRPGEDVLTLLLVLPPDHETVLAALAAADTTTKSITPLAPFTAPQEYTNFLFAFREAAAQSAAGSKSAELGTFVQEVVSQVAESGYEAAVTVLVARSAKKALVAFSQEAAAGHEPPQPRESPPRPDFVYWPVRALFVGSRGRSGIKSWLLGSVSNYVAKHSPLPIVVAKAPLSFSVVTRKASVTWLVAMDMAPEGFPSSLRALESLVPFVAADDLVILLCVISVEEAMGVNTDQYEKRPAKLAFGRLVGALKSINIRAKSELQVGDPATQICAVAHDSGVDVIAIGCRNSTANATFTLGSVSKAVLSKAQVGAVWVSK